MQWMGYPCQYCIHREWRDKGSLLKEKIIPVCKLAEDKIIEAGECSKNKYSRFTAKEQFIQSNELEI